MTEWYEDAIVLRVFIFIFLFRTSVKKGTWIRTTSVTVMVIFSKSFLVSYLITAMSRFLLNNYDSYFEQRFDSSILKDTLQWKILRTWIKAWVNMKRKSTKFLGYFLTIMSRILNNILTTAF